MDFNEEAYVKIVGVSGDYRYGYIEKITDRGSHFLISLDEEGASAIAYETESGSLSPDWDKMLSDTEKEIIEGLACGLTTKNMAEALSLSPITIRAYTRTLRLKLQLDNRQQLIAFAQGMNKRLKGE